MVGKSQWSHQMPQWEFQNESTDKLVVWGEQKKGERYQWKQG